ncbi:MAG: phosphopentomutase [Bacilli bacterium]
MKFKRIFLIVLDSLGVGALPDAGEYGDEGANTLGNIALNYPLNIPNMRELGLANIIPLNNIGAITNPLGCYTKAIEISKGKGTLTGHFEMMGIKTSIPLKRFTDTGFPKELIDKIEKQINRKVIGNIAASGTEIIKQLGEEHIKTGSIIIYTSADSVLQIAAHEDIIPIEELYEICKVVRQLTMEPEWRVGRIIARPFIGSNGNYIRTANRKDFALEPPFKTVLDYLKESNYDAITIGKIHDIFSGKGITKSIHTTDNKDGIDKIIEETKIDFIGLCFANLNDFDSKYGHRRNIEGYAKAIEEFDNNIPNIINNLTDNDLLIITADHGNDPTYKGTDHTREYVPVIMYSKNFKEPKQLEVFETFGNIGATIADNFNITPPNIGTSLLDRLK